MRRATPARVEATIRCGGLAETKTRWIFAILRTLHKEGKQDLEFLHGKTRDEAATDSRRFRMFSLLRLPDSN